MLSQRLGFHYGDNVELGGPGTYDVRVRTAPSSTRYTGEIAGIGADATFQLSMGLSSDTPTSDSINRNAVDRRGLWSRDPRRRPNCEHARCRCSPG